MNIVDIELPLWYEEDLNMTPQVYSTAWEIDPNHGSGLFFELQYKWRITLAITENIHGRIQLSSGS